MIKLRVEDRCHKCAHFEPCLVSYPTKLYAGNTPVEMLGDYVVSCANKDLCKDIYSKAVEEVMRCQSELTK